MAETQNLLESSPAKIKDFLNSFDYVLCDCDGVLWHYNIPISGALQTLKRLQDLGKKIFFVTNNCVFTCEEYCEKLARNGFIVKPEQVINPSKVVSWHLTKMNFHGDILAIVPAAFRKTLVNDGFTLIEHSSIVIETDVKTVKAVEDRPTIKAVIADFQVSFDWEKMALAISCLQRKDVLFFSGAEDIWVIYEEGKKVLGPGPLINVISKYSERTPIRCGKPGKGLKSYVLEMCKIRNPHRCLFIGDSGDTDMKFAAECGFLKLFVGSGIDDLETVQKNKVTYPDFYAKTLGLLHPIIDSFDNKNIS